MTLVVLKEFVNIEKTLSDAAEDGCTSNTDLNALDQQGRIKEGSIVDNKLLPINLF